MFFRSAMKSALTIYLPTYLTAKGSSLWIAGISLSILQFAGAGGTLLAGIISDKIGRRKSLLIISISNPILMFLFIYIQGIWMIPILIITGLFLFGSGPVILALVHDLDSKHMSFINGVYMTINFILSSVMVLAVGFFADTIGLDLTYKISAWIALGSIPFVFFIKR
jgi:FSR family fosmidomycin resistance protein-like MFS transporter